LSVEIRLRETTADDYAQLSELFTKAYPPTALLVRRMAA